MTAHFPAQRLQAFLIELRLLPAAAENLFMMTPHPLNHATPNVAVGKAFSGGEGRTMDAGKLVAAKVR